MGGWSRGGGVCPPRAKGARSDRRTDRPRGSPRRGGRPTRASGWGVGARGRRPWSWQRTWAVPTNTTERTARGGGVAGVAWPRLEGVVARVVVFRGGGHTEVWEWQRRVGRTTADRARVEPTSTRLARGVGAGCVARASGGGPPGDAAERNFTCCSHGNYVFTMATQVHIAPSVRRRGGGGGGGGGRARGSTTLRERREERHEHRARSTASFVPPPLSDSYPIEQERR